MSDFRQCIHCGIGQVGPNNCSACTWPYSEAGWLTFQMGIRRITIDTNCINAKRGISELNWLEKVASEGKIEIQKSTQFSVEAQGNLKREAKASQIPDLPPVFFLDASFLDGPAVLAGPDLRAEIRMILFPGVAQLSINQVRDVEHLAEHVRTGGHLFVTLDESDFIAGSKRQRLQRLGVWAVTPAKAMELLQLRPPFARNKRGEWPSEWRRDEVKGTANVIAVITKLPRGDMGGVRTNGWIGDRTRR